MDHGPVIEKETICFNPVKTDYLTLERETAELGAKLLEKILRNADGGLGATVPQSEPEATYTKKFTTDDAMIAPEDLARAEAGDEALALKIAMKINAFSAEPGAWTTTAGGRLKLLKATVLDGRLKLIITQREGEKPRSSQGS